MDGYDDLQEFLEEIFGDNPDEFNEFMEAISAELGVKSPEQLKAEAFERFTKYMQRMSVLAEYIMSKLSVRQAAIIDLLAVSTSKPGLYLIDPSFLLVKDEDFIILAQREVKSMDDENDKAMVCRIWNNGQMEHSFFNLFLPGIPKCFERIIYFACACAIMGMLCEKNFRNF